LASGAEGWCDTAVSVVWERLRRRGFAGWDPYDGLSCTRVPDVFMASSMGQRVLAQAVKRFPIPLQPMLGVVPEVDAYTLGHALTALARCPGVAAPDEASSVGAAILRSLRQMALDTPAGRAWGYHFPVRTRFFAYTSTTPNLIVTAFVGKGLAAATRAGLIDARDELEGIARFVTSVLPRRTDASGHCFGYIPGASTIIHNANMLGALVLCEAAESCGEEAWVDEALACARFTVARQADDGSWPYSEEPYGRWVDGFHTGFLLEGLARVVKASGDEALRCALERGVAFYVAQLFGPSGEPKYYPHRSYPLDALSAAQGVETLHAALGGPAARAVPGQIDWIRRHLVRPDGRVAYQVHHAWTDRREFPRWSSAPLMSALAGAAAAEVQQ
jgi:hypothetical protein